MPAQLYQPARAGASVNAAVSTSQIFADQINSAIPCVIAVPGSGRLEQQRFRILASGIATTVNASTTFLATLYAGQSFTPGSNTALGSLTATVINNTTASWWLEAMLMFDSVSGKLQGNFSGMINNSLIAAAVITNPLTGLNGTTAPAGTEPVFNLCVGATFGVNASASNVAKLGNFYLTS